VEVVQGGQGGLEREREDGSGQRRGRAAIVCTKGGQPQRSQGRRERAGAAEGSQRKEGNHWARWVLRGSFRQLASDSVAEQEAHRKAHCPVIPGHEHEGVLPAAVVGERKKESGSSGRDQAVVFIGYSSICTAPTFTRILCYIASP
jgi:hypothetical protein